jgi:hypothetical protein
MKIKKEKKLTKARIKKITRNLERRMDIVWSKYIKNKFNNKCYICGVTKQLTSHHLIPREIKCLRWNVKNGICLCVKHHKYSFVISPHRSPLAFHIKIIYDFADDINELLDEYIKFLKNDKEVKHE